MSKKNLFVFDTSLSLKTILVKRRGQPIYFLSKNPQIKLWYRQLGYASNARIVKISKLTGNIKIIIDKK